jgi:uracil-DNA glycosylase
MHIGNDWDGILAETFASEAYIKLTALVDASYASRTVYPPKDDIYNALRLTAFADTKIVILGQDPYPTAGAAHGLAFSVPKGARIPPSLANIYKELMQDAGINKPAHGNLENWAKQGVLLLNTVLTVEAANPRSHAKLGWELVTDAVLSALNRRAVPLVFMLWGNDAHKKTELLYMPQHRVLTAAHPSPLARGKFFGCGHFSKANDFLAKHGLGEVDWNV